MKKKLLRWILVGVMALNLCACGEQNDVSQEQIEQQESSVQEEASISASMDSTPDEKKEVELTSTEYTDVSFTKTDSAVIMNISGETFQIFQQLALQNDTENPKGAISQMDFDFWNDTAKHYYAYAAYIEFGQYACLEQELEKDVHNDVPFEITETGISISLTPELVDIDNLDLFSINIQSRNENYYIEDLCTYNVDGKLMVTKDSEDIITNEAMLQAAEQNKKQTVDQGQSANITQSQEQSDNTSYIYVGVTFVNEEGEILVINEVDSKGYPTSMTLDGNRESLSERDNLNKTESSWSLGVVWSRDDEGNPTRISDIGYDNINGVETIWIHGAYGGEYKPQ